MARERHRFAHSVHFLTASTNTYDRKWGLELGATDYFTTPYFTTPFSSTIGWQ